MSKTLKQHPVKRELKIIKKQRKPNQQKTILKQIRSLSDLNTMYYD